MNPKTVGRDRGGNPFSIANAVKPSKAPVHLHLAAEDGFSSYTEIDVLRIAREAYASEIVRVENQLIASARKLADMERRCAALVRERDRYQQLAETARLRAGLS